MPKKHESGNIFRVVLQKWLIWRPEIAKFRENWLGALSCPYYSSTTQIFEGLSKNVLPVKPPHSPVDPKLPPAWTRSLTRRDMNFWRRADTVDESKRLRQVKDTTTSEKHHRHTQCKNHRNLTIGLSTCLTNVVGPLWTVRTVDASKSQVPLPAGSIQTRPSKSGCKEMYNIKPYLNYKYQVFL